MGTTAIAVGVDSDEVATRLEPWRIDDVGGPIDYSLELEPPLPEGRRGLRSLPAFRHGTLTLARSRRRQPLIEAFLRVLASHREPAGEGQVRVRLTAAVRDGVAVLADPVRIASLSERWLEGHHIAAFSNVSSLVDGRRGHVLIDAPLGSDEAPDSFPLGGWWLPPGGTNDVLTPGEAVAQIMQLVLDLAVERAQGSLETVAALVYQAHPEVAPGTDEDVRRALPGVMDRAVMRVGASTTGT